MVVIGGGFGGLQAVQKLARMPVEVTLIDRRNFHLFQPLTYQVATGALSAEEVAYPLRAIFKRRRNVRVLLGEVRDVDLEGRTVQVQPGVGEGGPITVPYDTLIAAGGSRYSYFGHDEWETYAHEVKSLGERAQRARADPERLRGRRAGDRRGAQARLADLRRGRRRPDRGGDGRARSASSPATRSGGTSA